MTKSERRTSKAAMKRLLKSKFFHEVIEIVKAWDYYLITGERDLAKEMMDKWFVAKEALEFITGNVYEFSRNGTTYSIVNERNYDDRLFIGLSIVPEEKAS
jgi:hypothetical protein